MKKKIAIGLIVLAIIIGMTIYSNMGDRNDTADNSDIYTVNTFDSTNAPALYIKSQEMQSDHFLVGRWEMVFDWHGEPSMPLNYFVFEVDGAGLEVRYLPDRTGGRTYLEIVHQIVWAQEYNRLIITRIYETTAHTYGAGKTFPIACNFELDGDYLTLTLITGAEYSPLPGIVRMQRVE